MSLIVVYNLFKSVWHFTAIAFDRPELMFEERLPFCGKYLLLSFLVRFKSVWHLTEMPLIVLSPCLKIVLHFTAPALDRRV